MYNVNCIDIYTSKRIRECGHIVCAHIVGGIVHVHSHAHVIMPTLYVQLCGHM